MTRFGDIPIGADVELTPYTSGALDARPTSTPGTQGKAGRIYKATDTGQIFLDHGTGWDELTTEARLGKAMVAAYRSGAWSGVSGSLVTMDAVLVNEGALWNLGSQYGVVTIAGWYECRWAVRFSAPPNLINQDRHHNFAAFVSKNSSLVAEGSTAVYPGEGTSTTDITSAGAALLQFAVNDVLAVGVQHTAGVAVAVVTGAAYTYLHLNLLQRV